MTFGLHHIGLTTRSLASALEFYSSNFSMEILRQGKIDDSLTQLRNVFQIDQFNTLTAIGRIGNTYLEFFEFLEPTQESIQYNKPEISRLGFCHLCLQTHNVWEDYERLQGKMNFHSPPITMPNDVKLVYGRDPDQNIIELIEIPNGLDFPNLLDSS